jgi:hypothetical protein
MTKNVANFRITRSNVLRLISLTIFLAIFLFPLKVNAQGAKANFAGTWAINETKSKLGEAGGFRRPAKQLTVKQEGNNLSVERIRVNRDGQDTPPVTSKYTLDGKECSNTMSMGGNDMTSKSILTWSADGKALTIATSMDFNGTVRKSSEVWKLTDAKTLSVNSTSTNRDGAEVKATIVYDKK